MGALTIWVLVTLADAMGMIDFSKRIAATASVLSLLLCTSAQAEQSRKLIIIGDLPKATDADVSFCDESLQGYSREYSEEFGAWASQPEAEVLVVALGFPFSQEYVQSLENFPLLKEYFSDLVEDEELPGRTSILPGGFGGKLLSYLKCSPKGEQRRCLYIWPKPDVSVHQFLCDSLKDAVKY